MSDKSISELWGEFYPIGAGMISFWNSVADTHPGKAKAIALRATLLEQGDHDRAQDGRHVSMTFEGDGIVRVDLAAPVRCNADDLKNFAARANFLAWELEQRQREAIGDRWLIFGWAAKLPEPLKTKCENDIRGLIGGGFFDNMADALECIAKELNSDFYYGVLNFVKKMDVVGACKPLSFWEGHNAAKAAYEAQMEAGEK